MSSLGPENTQAKIGYNDLREWIAEADKLGELRVAEGYNWEEEIGMAAELLQHNDDAPVALFDKIPGVPEGYRVLTNFFSGKRKNMTLGFPADLNKIELSQAFLQQFRQAAHKPLPYKTVKRGPVLENVIKGDSIDITKFPTPVWHDRDEGRRYIGTGSFNVTIDPDEKWINVGTYRVMIQDEKSVGFYISPGKHGRIHRDKYMAYNKPMPVCVVIGGDPLTFLMACSELPYGVCEYEIAGAYRGKPLEVVEGEFTGLTFPANAEIAIEGFVERMADRFYDADTCPKDKLSFEWIGNSGELLGYYTDMRAMARINPIDAAGKGMYFAAAVANWVEKAIAAGNILAGFNSNNPRNAIDW